MSLIVRKHFEVMIFPLLRIASVPVLLLALAVPAGSYPAPALAQAVGASTASPVGRWKTIDDHTGKPKSIVEIREPNGTLTGSILTLLNPPTPHPTCNLCSGAKKDQPLVGLEILWGFHLDGDQWGADRFSIRKTAKSIAPRSGSRTAAENSACAATSAFPCWAEPNTGCAWNKTETPAVC